MKGVSEVMSTLGIDAGEAAALVAKAVVYSNPGYGTVLKPSQKAIERLKLLFDQRPIWLSAELDKEVGWQFSQAVFYLRRQGYVIQTMKLTNRVYAYKLVNKPNENTGNPGPA